MKPSISVAQVVPANVVLLRVGPVLQQAAADIADLQDANLLNAAERRARAVKFYQGVRSTFCAEFRPLRERRRPNYWHTLCASGTQGSGREFNEAQCGQCSLHVAEVPGLLPEPKFVQIRK